MAKIKAAYGDFLSQTCGPGATIVNDANVLVNLRREACFSITNRCRVHGVFFFNSSASTSGSTDEKHMKLTDIASGTYAEATAAPILYSTVVPRDAAFKKRWNADFWVTDWDFEIEMDIYDTPTGIYDTFPKPGFLFENGVAVWNDTAGSGTKLHWLIFYSE